MNKNFRKTVILFFILVIFSFAVSAAPPAATWWGRVNISGVQYNTSGIVHAYIVGVRFASANVGEYTSGYYHIDVPCDEEDSIGFKVWGIQVDQSNQTCSQGARTELNLTATKLADNVACTYSPACSGGYCCDGATVINGTGSGTCQASMCSAPSTPTDQGTGGGTGGAAAAEECTELWSCTAWTPCSNGKQTRTCTDSNNCGTTKNKPSEERSCVEKEEEEVPPEEEEEAPPVVEGEERPPTEEGSFIGQVQVNDNVNWKWSGTEWVKEGAPGYEEIEIILPIFGGVELMWVYIFGAVIVIAIAVVFIEVWLKKSRGPKLPPKFE